MAKKYYIKMTEKLMRYKDVNSTEKIFLAFLEVLTEKAERSTDKSNLFFAEKLGKSTNYIAAMIPRLAKINAIVLTKEYGRRNINLSGIYIQKYMNEKRGKNDRSST